MRRFLVPILLGLTMLACTNSKENQCAAIRKAIRAEMVATKEVASKMRDPQALGAHAEFLTTTISGLRKLEIKDPALKQAVVTYSNAVEKLAEGYQAAGDKLPGPGSELMIYGTIVDSSRIRIADECNLP